VGTSYQIRNQEGIYFLTFQVVGWADIFSRKCYRDIIINSLDYSRKNKGLKVYAYVIMTNHVHLVVRSKDGNLSDIVRDVKKLTPPGVE
jgi:REP element-mobilizing transposase RayT